MVEQALGHRIKSTVERSYRRGDLFERRGVLMAAWDRYCNGELAAEVIELRGVNPVVARRFAQPLYTHFLARVIKIPAVQCHRGGVTEKNIAQFFFSEGRRPGAPGGTNFKWPLDPAGSVRGFLREDFVSDRALRVCDATSVGRGDRGLWQSSSQPSSMAS